MIARSLAAVAAAACTDLPAVLLHQPAGDGPAGAARTRTRSSRRIGPDTGIHPDFGTRVRDPVRPRRPGDAALEGLLRLRRRVRPRPLPDPARRPHRGRRRPPRAAASTSAAAGSTSSTRSSARARGWHAGSGATWNLRSKKLRPKGWTSADAAGLPIFPLLARYGEVKRGRDPARAARDRRRSTRDAYVYPARHVASTTATRRCRGWASGCG